MPLPLAVPLFAAFCIAFGFWGAWFDERFSARLKAERRLKVQMPRATGLYFHPTSGGR